MYAGRRTVLTAGAAGAAGLVTACGSSGDGGGRPASAPETSRSATPSTGASAASTEGSVPGGEALAKTSDIPIGGGKVFEEQEVVVTQPKEGEFKGFSAICTHKGCTVVAVSDGTINCPCHGSRYRITDAAVVAGPAPQPLAAERITVTGDTIRLG
ncbi:Rieske (2Fe-2S) protein [Streptomyces sp. NBC_01800]|uniref:Rieske (2Fe-2S) protein n=1 Tax=Streptomyces sp. NBC_01800 TaxID=2975945 RepID=UPI002DDC1712|nr:Rieske (2Fe-2S) protein [Streptomyces sp. NBC_01800]WSA66707.1 Rieske (2Fe-2S) protein [Streptomyces sp. NBC_01800]